MNPEIAEFIVYCDTPDYVIDSLWCVFEREKKFVACCINPPEQSQHPKKITSYPIDSLHAIIETSDNIQFDTFMVVDSKFTVTESVYQDEMLPDFEHLSLSAREILIMQEFVSLAQIMEKAFLQKVCS